MSDIDKLKQLLNRLGIPEKLEEVINKKNINGPTTKIDQNGSLIWLDLSSLGISKLPPDIFEGLSNLEELKLFKNNITELPEEIFDSVPNLTELHLKDNDLSELKRRHFVNLSKLSRLFLLGNSKLGDLAKVYPNPMAVNAFLQQLN